MPYTFRAALCLLILTSSAFAQSHSTTSTPASVADEAIVRALTVQYREAMAAGDLEAMRKFWRPESPNLAAHFRYYKNVFAQARIQFNRPELTSLEIKGDRAVSQLTSDESRFDKQTGAAILTYDPFRGASHSFEWAKTTAGWRLEREFLVQDELAARLVEAKSERERDGSSKQRNASLTSRSSAPSAPRRCAVRRAPSTRRRCVTFSCNS